MGLTTAADIEKYESDLSKRVWFLDMSCLCPNVLLLAFQNLAKANLTRTDYYSSDRLQLRTGSGRQSSGPDPRRGESDSQKSHERETTPKLGPAPSTVTGTGPPGRKMRMYSVCSI